MANTLFNKIQMLTIVWLAAALLSTASLGAPAQRSALASTSGLPAYYPANFQKTGIVREPPSSNRLIISGLKYQITSSTKIHTLSNQFSSSWSLKNGEEVGFTFTSDAAKNRTISEIWVLPKGSITAH